MEFHTETRFLSFPSLCHHWAMATEQHQYTISHMTTCCEVHEIVAKHGNMKLSHSTNNKPKTSFEKRLETVFVWNCFLIIHLHLTWVSMGTGARVSFRGRPWYPEFWARPPRDTMWLVSGHGPWESQTPKLGSSKTTIPKTHKQENCVSNSVVSTCLGPSLESWLLQLP